MRFTLVLVSFLCTCSAVFAQISGIVVSKSTRKPLNMASLALTGGKDSVILHTGTDGQGHFLFEMPPSGKYKLSVSFLGYTGKVVAVDIPPGKESIWLDSILLQPAVVDLSQVNIKGNKSLVSKKGDTLEFNAADFKTAKKASLLNLFQKLPGITIDVDGNFFFQGVPIHELYINGRPAFQNAQDGSSDPKMLSRMLLASMIEKIQLTDKKQMTGLNTPSGQKIINITIKKESKQRIGGDLGAGYGTRNSYKLAANATRFRDHSQLIAMASQSNVSSISSPASSDESMDMNMRFPGTARDSKVALNAGWDAGVKAKFNLSFTHTEKTATQTETHMRENFLPQGSNFYNSTTDKKNHIATNILNTNFSYDFNDRNKFTLRADVFFTRSDAGSTNHYSTLAQNKIDTINYGNLYNNEAPDDKRAFFNTEYTREFKTGGLFRLAVNYDLDHNNSRQLNYALNQIHTLTNLASQWTADTTNQQIIPKTKNDNLMVNTQFFKPLGKQFYFQATYNLTLTNVRSNQLALNFHEPVKKYILVDSTLSYSFKNTAISQVIGTSFNFHKGKFNASLGATLGNNDFNSTGNSAAFDIQQHNQYLSPTINVSWNFSTMSALRMDFSSSPLFAVSDRLIPIISVQNPMQVQLGNPDLKPGFVRRISLDYTLMNTNGLTFSIGGFASFEYNSISTAANIDSSGKQVTMPVNVDGTHSFSPMLNLGKRWQSAGISIAYRAFADLRRTVSYLNKESNINRSIFFNQDFLFSWTYKNLLELSTITQINFRGNKYSLQNNAFYHFTDQKIFLKIAVFLPAEIQVGTAAMYMKNSGLDQPVTLLNGWISKLLTKNKSWMIKLYGFDLLGENKTQMALVSPNFIDRTISNAQQQYFMFSLTRFFK